MLLLYNNYDYSNPHLPHIDRVLELARCGARACEECAAVAVRIGVEQCNGLVERIDLEHLEADQFGSGLWGDAQVWWGDAQVWWGYVQV